MFRRLLNERYVIHSVLGVGTASFGVIYSSHAIFSDKIAKIYKVTGADGTPIHLKASLKIHFDELTSDFDLTDWKKKFFHLFICEGLEPIQLGSTQVHKGVQVGIPQFMQASNAEEIKQCKILIDNKPVDWDSPDGEKLLESLQLSDNAKRFLIAKFILQADNYKFLIDSFLPSVMLTTFYGAGLLAHQFLDLMHKPFLSSVFVHSVLGGVVVLIYLFLKDAIALNYDKSIEEKIYEKGESYIVGGIEYYEKLIQRNKALRNLCKKGHKRYSIHGNEISLLRSKGLPETFKLKMAIDSLEKNYQKQYATSIPIPKEPKPIY